MNFFGITAIRWNDEHTQVASCMVHDLERESRRFVMGEGRQMWFADVASLINGRDRVLVMEMDADGEWQPAANVLVRSGADPYLYTLPESILFDLPAF